MFGKYYDTYGNLARGKMHYGFNPRVRGTCLVSIANNNVSKGIRNEMLVSIPVCGEHVW
jgi:hypothetical protein